MFVGIKFIPSPLSSPRLRGEDKGEGNFKKEIPIQLNYRSKNTNFQKKKSNYIQKVNNKQKPDNDLTCKGVGQSFDTCPP
jgi:hypothetical protein